MNNEPSYFGLTNDHTWLSVDEDYYKKLKPTHRMKCYTHPAKTLTDEEWNKAFEYYCETDEGVLKFDLELRNEWKKEQLIRWKEALRKAQENDRFCH